jgi:hypothetical protein
VKILEILENDVRKLKHDLSIYQTHILKTEVWCDNIGAIIYFLKFEPILCLITIFFVVGKWTTRVASARVVPANDPFLADNNVNDPMNSSSPSENLLLFEIYVELHEETTSDKESLENNSLDTVNQFKDGWIIYRSLKQFEALHEKLIELIPVHIKNQFKKLPNLKRNLLSKNFNDEKIKQSTLILNDYLKVRNIKNTLVESF